jgi:hypothetical protein
MDYIAPYPTDSIRFSFFRLARHDRRTSADAEALSSIDRFFADYDAHGVWHDRCHWPSGDRLSLIS